MQDVQLSVWTRVSGEPVKMGSLYVTDTEARFAYDAAFCDSGLPGLSVIYPPEVYRDNAVVHHRPAELPPRFRALIPPRDETNFQRKLMLAYLRQSGIEPEGARATDLALLAHTGHGGVGHIDVFSDDPAAADWYAHRDSGPLVPLGDRFGFSLKEFVSWLDADARLILESLGPTPSIGGAVPKLLVGIPADGWDGRISLPTKDADPTRTDVVLKIERSQAYPGMMSLEALTLDLHREAGFETPRYWRAEVSGMPALAVERFDRDAQGLPIPQESLFAILCAGAADIEQPYDGNLERIGNVIELGNPLIVSDKRTARRYLFRRLVLALLTGNGDLHLENLSLLGPAGEAAFSPVYDPTPMRAYSQHDMLCAVPFGGYGEADFEGDDPVAPATLRFGQNLGLNAGEISEIVAELIGLTASYPQRLDAIDDLPADNRQRLTGIHRDITTRLTTLVR